MRVLIQKHHLHVAYCENPPLVIGPAISAIPLSRYVLLLVQLLYPWVRNMYSPDHGSSGDVLPHITKGHKISENNVNKPVDSSPTTSLDNTRPNQHGHTF